MFSSLLLLLLGLLASCAERPAGDSAGNPGAAAPPPVQPPALPVADTPPVRVVFLGDSLTAGYGLSQEQAFPALLAERFAAAGLAVKVVNAGVSGDTTADGATRLDWLLGQRPDLLVVGLGGNDGLRGLPLAMTEANLRQIVLRARQAGCRVLLLGMLMPPNYGPDYARGFAAIYPRLAAELEVPLVPFLLAGVAGRPELNQADGIHPTAEGQVRVAEHLWPFLQPLVAELSAARRAG